MLHNYKGGFCVKINKQQLLTIPNMLSIVRLLMIPLFVALYLNGHIGWTAIVLILSGLTDVVDGYIARRFNQVSDIGKALDPVADKLTQAAMLLCLVAKHPVMAISFWLLLIKEVFAAISGIMVVKCTGVVPGAEWHGKVTTMLLYGMMILHLIWQEIPVQASNSLNVVCILMMLLSLILYGRRNIRLIRNARRLDD